MRDEVDELLEAWGRERSDLDLAPVGVFSRVSRLARRLELARRDAFAAHGIEQWEFDVLAALRRAGAPYEQSPGRLLRETLVTSGTMTNRVDRLSARGLVERYPDPDDRRGVIVRLTSEGKATVDAAFAALLEAERELLDTLPERDRAKLASLLRALLAPFADSAQRTAERRRVGANRQRRRRVGANRQAYDAESAHDDSAPTREPRRPRATPAPAPRARPRPRSAPGTARSAVRGRPHEPAPRRSARPRAR